MVEDFLERQPAPGTELPAGLAEHAAGCRACATQIENALRSHWLLQALQAEAEPADDYFGTRLRARLEALQAARRRGWMRGLSVAGRDLALAAALFATMLGSFLYNFQRTERPNADEAMALDVPHLNPMHPSDDHLRPKPVDVMVNLMNP